jgi:cytochrome c oxidase assembly protein subunit 15
LPRGLYAADAAKEFTQIHFFFSGPAGRTIAAMDADDSDLAARRRLLHWFAVMGTAVVLLVTTSSAFLRVSWAGLGCDDWPDCYGRASVSEPSDLARASPVRLLHRISATFAGASVLGIGLIALTQPRRFRFELIASGVLLLVALGLALLGRSTPGAIVPGVAMGNVLGGMLMASILFRVALEQRVVFGQNDGGRAAPMWLSGLCWLALALTFVQIGLGVLTSASFSGLACTALPACTEQGFPGAWSVADLNPWRPAAGSPSIHMAHRVATLAVTATVLAVVWGLGRLGSAARRLRWVLLALLAGQALLGVLMVYLSLPRPLAVAHNVGAGLLLLALAAAQYQMKRTAALCQQAT